MPHAETSPVRRHRTSQSLTQKGLAEKAGISASTVGVIERQRNPRHIRDLLDQGLDPSRTTVEVTVRIAAALGLMEYGQNYTLEEVAKMQKLIAKRWLTDRPARCKREYPGANRRPHLRVVA